MAYFSNIVGVVSFYSMHDYSVCCLGPKDYRGDLISGSPQLGVPLYMQCCMVASSMDATPINEIGVVEYGCTS